MARGVFGFSKNREWIFHLQKILISTLLFTNCYIIMTLNRHKIFSEMKLQFLACSINRLRVASP